MIFKVPALREEIRDLTVSLVGSEMCIRDRFKTTGVYSMIFKVPALKEYIGDPLDMYSVNGCLLYTSDAADEYACV